MADPIAHSSTDPHRERLITVLALSSLDGIGPASVHRIVGHFGPLTPLRAMCEGIDAVHSLSPSKRQAIREAGVLDEIDAAIMVAERRIDECSGLDIAVIDYWHPDFPTLLHRTGAGPVVLYIKGARRFPERTIAGIGTREPTRFGTAAATSCTRHLAEEGWTILSGLARGIDTTVHEAALAAGGHTVAILANGLDTVYPAENAGLARRIIAAGGSLVSENPPGTAAQSGLLVSRDRIQAGMSLAVAMYESSTTGGAMHAAMHARKLSRPVICPVPTPTFRDEPSLSGNLAILGWDRGVIPLRSANDYPHLHQTLKGHLTDPVSTDSTSALPLRRQSMLDGV